ncbi:MAG: anti-sigma factor domain-containing protein [Desulfotomaculaceae bacterium]|nr:anti-sigma factor domain-containing protein [Desulfotomaculaceae bacterium]
MKTSGMIVKITGKSCIILTREGEYRKVPLPAGSTRLGQLINLEEKRKIPYIKLLAVAASVLMIALCGHLWTGQMQPAAAYLTIDINPSVELGVAADQRVVSARGLNSEGDSLMREVQVLKLNLHEAVEQIVAQAIKNQYLADNDDNVILVTITTGQNEEAPLVDVDGIYESVKSQLAISPVNTEVIIEPVESSVRQEAEKAGISTGRYILLQNTAKKGVKISASEINSINLGKLQKEKKVSVIELIRENKAVKATDSSKNQEKRSINRGVYMKLQKSAGAYSEQNIEFLPEGKKKSNNYEKIAETKKNDTSSRNKSSRENSWEKSNNKDINRKNEWGNNRDNNKNNNKENNRDNNKDNSRENNRDNSRDSRDNNEKNNREGNRDNIRNY